MILREVPDLPPRPLTAANAAFRRWFYARWGKENAVILTHTRDVEYPPYQQVLSIRAVWNGAEHFDLGHRRVSVDDDSYLVLNRRTYGSTVATLRPVGAISVFFRPGMEREIAAAQRQSLAQSLDAPDAVDPCSMEFAEHLRAHDAQVTPQLRALRTGIEEGIDDEQWLEEQLQQLLAAMLNAERGVRRRPERLRDLSRSTRDELQRRIDRATDFIHSAYARPLTLDDVAAAARLSKFHLVRLFKRAHGVTPIAFLGRKRGRVAQRLIAASDLPLDEIAPMAGFGSRVSMFRQLRSQFGASGRDLRAARRANRG